jgi:hypothetical protein
MNPIKKWLLIRANRKKSREIDQSIIEGWREAARQQRREHLKDNISKVIKELENIGFKFTGKYNTDSEFTTATSYGHLNNQLVELEVVARGAYYITYVKKS